jgi:hypothetical protein
MKLKVNGEVVKAVFYCGSIEFGITFDKSSDAVFQGRNGSSAGEQHVLTSGSRAPRPYREASPRRSLRLAELLQSPDQRTGFPSSSDSAAFA